MIRFQRLPFHVSRSPQYRSSPSMFLLRSLYKGSMIHIHSLPWHVCRVHQQQNSFQVLFTKPLHGDRCSISRAFFDVTSRDLSTGSLPPPRFPLQSSERETERDDLFPELLLPVSQKPRKKNPLFRFSNGAAMERDVPHQNLPLRILQSP